MIMQEFLESIEWKELTLKQYEDIKDTLRKCCIIIDGYFRLYLVNGEGVRYTIEVMRSNDTVMLHL